jgi:hypothetical protein
MLQPCLVRPWGGMDEVVDEMGSGVVDEGIKGARSE